MAITMRHGPYNKFDPQKLRTGELAVVTEGDPHASDGKAIYQCFSPGDVKRMATYEDMVDQIDEAGGEVIDNHIDEKVGTALKACESATKAAQDAKTNADKAVSSANTATNTANKAAETASKAAETASKAAEDCKNLIDEKHVAEIEKAVQQSLMADTADGTVTGKTVTDLPENTAPADTDNVLIGTGKLLKRLSLSNLLSTIKDKILTWTYDKLSTTDKTLPGAVNELNTKLLKAKKVSSEAFSLTANTTKEFKISLSLPSGAEIKSISVIPRGGMQFSITVSRIAADYVTVNARSTSDLTGRTVDVYVLYV